MTIQIGSKKLAISRAGDLETKLLDATGFSVAEFAGALASYQTPFQIARVLHPMLTEPMPLGDLSTAIEAAGADSVRADVLALLVPPPIQGVKVHDPRPEKKVTRKSAAKPKAQTKTDESAPSAAASETPTETTGNGGN